MLELLTQEITKRAVSNPGKTIVVGIDGPTASGKTILADKLNEHMVGLGYHTWVYRVDWALEERSKRVKDLTNLKNAGSSFAYEAELHMRLEIVEEFLSKVRKFDELGAGDAGAPTMELTGLYSRADEGRCTGSVSLDLSPGMIIFYEGHYTLRTELDRFTDLNIVLLSDPEELLSRKVQRVKGYRGADEATDYFWRIDLPSFKNHLKNHAFAADIVVDNTDYNQPVLKGNSFAIDWMNGEHENEIKLEDSSTLPLFEQMFSVSLNNDIALKAAFYAGIEFIRKWDGIISEYLRISLVSVEKDLDTKAKELIREINGSLSSSQYSLQISSTNLIYNVYYRALPVSICFEVVDIEGENQISFLADCFFDKLELQVLWKGGRRVFQHQRSLNITQSQDSNELELSTAEIDGVSKAQGPVLICPTDFTIPSFIEKDDYQIILIGKEAEVLSGTRCIKTILEREGVWVQRFAKFSEIRFYQNILANVGVPSIKIGSYLIACRTSEPARKRKFRDFVKQWEPTFAHQEIMKKSEASADEICEQDIQSARAYVAQNCQYFSLLDGHIFSYFMSKSGEQIEQALEELGKMLGSSSRFLRKRAHQFIEENFPNLSMKTDELWDDVPRDALSEISLREFNDLSPSILAEVYLWLQISGNQGAILGANVYDIRQNSIDIESHLRASYESSSPIVIQTSLNAIGQREEQEGKVFQGYLKLENGAIDYVDGVMSTIRNMYLSGKPIPLLYGIGLDHVASEHDRPSGRARRFLEMAVETGKITHYVQDGSALFSSPDRKPDNLKASFTKMAAFSTDLAKNLKNSHHLDTEICTGELNYFDGTSRAFIPTPEEIDYFIDVYEKAVMEAGKAELLVRPLLYIANCGTVHHGGDTSVPEVDVGGGWIAHSKKRNFISPVLHGTTKTHKDVLAKASQWYRKINIAGNFLFDLIDSLPQSVSSVINDGPSPKMNVHKVREQLEGLSPKEKDSAIGFMTQQSKAAIDVMNSPKLSQNDLRYFKYGSFKLSDRHIRVLTDTIKNEIFELHSHKVKREASSVSCRFSASLIEVPYERFKTYADELIDKNINCFHIDAGDGDFIPRAFSGVDKVKYLSKRKERLDIHAHLMVRNPHYPHQGQLCPIQQYADAGCTSIAIHPRSFDHKKALKDSLGLIRSLGCRPGIVIETSDELDDDLKTLLLEQEISWVVVMGVPIGYGGQLFRYPTLRKISAIKKFAISSDVKIEIEIDGGLTKETLALSRNAGADLFAGWSIIKPKEQAIFSHLIDEVNQILHQV